MPGELASTRHCIACSVGPALQRVASGACRYSGDWSRIGAISKDTEELLRLGAYVVVPLSLALIFSLSQDSNK